MDRYFIARQAVSEKKLVIPDSDDVKKYSEQNSDKYTSMERKADLCALIAQRNKNKDETATDYVKRKNLMCLSYEELSTMVPGLWKKMKVDKNESL
jgi:hypothetical protein